MRKLRGTGQDQEGRRVAGNGGSQPAALRSLEGAAAQASTAAPLPRVDEPVPVRKADQGA
jgi:hypothetical protein